MDTLPLEILRYYIKGYRECVALRRTCKWYRDFTVAADVYIQVLNGQTLNENGPYMCHRQFLMWNRRTVRVMFSRLDVINYLVLASYTGAEYTMWLCSKYYNSVKREIDNITAAGYTYYVKTGVRTAVYIKTSELLDKIYTPPPDYCDGVWPREYYSLQFFVYKKLIVQSTYVMETLPLEILRYYINDYHDCIALRRTCRWYRNFTINGTVHIEDMNDRVVNENHHYFCLNVYIIWNRRDTHFLNKQSGMRHYLVMSSCVGAEYTMWLCGQQTAMITREIAKLAAAKYTYYVALGARTAVYVKTSELVERMFVPSTLYNDMIWV